MLKHPISVYINWASYDELSDNIELTETIAMRQLDELLRLRKLGVRLDYYLMDAFWYAPNGGYRVWRKPHWPDGPERWLARCLENDVKPGLWLSTNTLCKLEPVPAWEDSLNGRRSAMCLFYGGFLAHFLETMHLWYQRGVRIFKFDFCDFGAATPALTATMTPSEIRARNIDSLRAGLKSFRDAHPEVVLIAYNGFEDQGSQHGTSVPFFKSIEPGHWLDTFDSVYCGDPRPADVPCANFWRSKDIYSDHMVRWFERCGFPLSRIDNSGFMVGTTGTCYFRKTAAWKGMLLLSLARGGWVNTYYGNLDLITESDAKWFAKVQRMFLAFQDHGRITTFGGVPGKSEPYGFAAADTAGGLVTLVNPSQSVARIELPEGVLHAEARFPARIIFRDKGGPLAWDKAAVTLGPEQMCVIATGRCTASAFDLGEADDVVIPARIDRVEAAFEKDGEKAILARLALPRDSKVGDRLRVIMRQFIPQGQQHAGHAHRTSGGSPPKGTTLGKMLTISVEHAGKAVPVMVEYDKAIWSGLSWAVGEIDLATLAPAPNNDSSPLVIRCATTEKVDVELRGEVYVVRAS